MSKEVTTDFILEYAKEYARLLVAALERGNKTKALEYADHIQSLLLRDRPIEITLQLEKRHAEIPAEVRAA